mmetsp:Transcript_14667/g.41253  ORF Transcript_14667/g.41253 Transcript_14667/m.41253 type:complete len:178 (+) Transcript_14667:235-768(+)|eukprot:CAMPEP_0117670418 /NCGR_PEP_ID=MMETSP0804-20121206/12738_1 /TAXON_ID=1074897 /ORGANISM="Tetraselmis astigmatica, Strain CCMP880" /LENGTH=177 /DNA_ID=CAMNT_0005478707 /DNA_START=178 /DNA_END=711 /DNA_ORIENTATION=-
MTPALRLSPLIAVSATPVVTPAGRRGEVCSSGRYTIRTPNTYLTAGHAHYCSEARTVHSAWRMATGTPGSGTGGNVIDRPTILPGKDIKKQSSKRRPPIYKVLLHNDNTNRREYVVKVLLKVVDGLTVDDAVNVMQEAHLNGLALVISCAQSDAERYCNGLRSNGLVATMEPDGGGS